MHHRKLLSIARLRQENALKQPELLVAKDLILQHLQAFGTLATQQGETAKADEEIKGSKDVNDEQFQRFAKVERAAR